MNFLERDFAGRGDFEIARIENHEADERERDHAERIDPVKPARGGVPHGVGS